MFPSQEIYPGTAKEGYFRELEAIRESRLVERLWAKDETLRPTDEFRKESTRQNLRWLDLPMEIGPQMQKIVELRERLAVEDFADVFVVAIGGSNLAAESVLAFSAEEPRWRVHVIDTIDPDTLRGLTESVDLRKSFFVFANKSGTHIETHALLLHFLEQIRTAGLGAPGPRCIAVTEEGSYLETLAKEYRFQALFSDSRHISNRFSGALHFGLSAVAFWRLMPCDLLGSLESMREACGVSTPEEKNPAAVLAAFFVACAGTGINRFVLAGGQRTFAFTRRIAHVIGEAVCQNGSQGGERLIVVPTPIGSRGIELPHGCAAVLIESEQDPDATGGDAAIAWQAAGVPFARIKLAGLDSLSAEILKWEIATALLASRLQFNPFYQPDVRESRVRAMEILDDLSPPREMIKATVRVRERGIELFAEGVTRQQISTLTLSEAVRSFLELRVRNGYLAILTYLPRNVELTSKLDSLREHLATLLGIPVLLAQGPRYLHYFGQLFKGGPANGLFLMLTNGIAKDVPIPGAGYTFGQLHMALAQGDFDAMVRRGRLIFRLHLADGAEQGLAAIESIFYKTHPRLAGTGF